MDQDLPTNPGNQLQQDTLHLIAAAMLGTTLMKFVAEHDKVLEHIYEEPKHLEVAQVIGLYGTATQPEKLGGSIERMLSQAGGVEAMKAFVEQGFDAVLDDDQLLTDSEEVAERLGVSKTAYRAMMDQAKAERREHRSQS